MHDAGRVGEFADRMHGELRRTDIDRLQAQFGGQNGSNCAAAGGVIADNEVLNLGETVEKRCDEKDGNGPAEALAPSQRSP